MRANEKKYYEVECKCGHVGRDYYIPIRFAVTASSKKEAAAIGRHIPRCKHHHKDCVLNVRELSFQEFVKLKEENANDPYLRCTNKQEQSLYDLSNRLVKDLHFFEHHDQKTEKENQKHQIFQGKDKIRNPKKYIKLYELKEACCY